MRAWSTCIQSLLFAAVILGAKGAAAQEPRPDNSDEKHPTRPSDERRPVTPGAPADEPPPPPAAPSPPDEAPEPPDDADDASDEPDPSRPPPAGKGAVWGTVKSASTNDTLLECVVSVLGRREKATTDTEGRYRLELPPGTYQLRFVYELHRPARLKNVVVQGGKVTKADVALQHDDSAVEEVTAIEAEVERASAATQLFLRKNAAQASDSVGAQDIARTPDRNAAEAVKRVVGTTVVDGRYIFVRGLGDRYTNSMLNGSPLPSPEPDRQAVPLDMFPTLVLADLTISKTFVPDMPGDFTGGSLDIHTRELPNKFLFQVTGGLGMNRISTFGHRLGYPGGATDWLGFDDGGRRLSQEVPGSPLVEIDRNTGRRNDFTAAGRAINRDMATTRELNLPHGSLSAVVGDSFRLGKKRVLGYVLGASYTRRFQKRVDEIIRTYGAPSADNPGQLVRRNDYVAETGLDTVTWSSLGSVSYAFDEDHRIVLTGLYSRNAEKEGRFISGFNDEAAKAVNDERLRFVNRGLYYAQLRGEHRFPKLAKAVITWNALTARATLNDPDLRETVYVQDPADNRFFFLDNSTQSGQHFHAAQGETTRGAAFNWLQPLASFDGAPKLKAGGMVTLRGRSFQARRFRFLKAEGADTELLRLPPNELFRDENVGPVLQISEWTRPTDSYAARYDVYAGYVMTDLPVTSRLRFVVGPRIEAAVQTIDSFSPFGDTGERVTSRLAKTDILPSANAIFKVTGDSNVRLSATRTVARPQLRELAPFVFTDFFGAREILGNPLLDRTTIANFDARYEIFPHANEVVAISLFHKRFEKPIESYIIPTGRGVVSFQNARGAVNTGLELEARKGLEFVSQAVKDFSVLGNVTFVSSKVELDPAQGGIQTSRERPLAGQSAYVANVALDWTHEKTRTRARILYNVQGARIAQVGTQGIPDIYEQPRHLVDVSAAQGIGEHVDLKLTLDNLFDSPVRFTHGREGDVVTGSYRVGQTVWLMATYSN